MTHLKLWLAGGVVVLILGAVGVSVLTAQRTPPYYPSGNSEVGRYVVVSFGPKGIIILDTTTGELYEAAPSDIKPHHARPKPPRDDWGYEAKKEGKKDEARKSDEKKDVDKAAVEKKDEVKKSDEKRFEKKD